MKQFLKILLAVVIGSIISVILSQIILFGLIGAFMSSTSADSIKEPKSAILRINLDSPINDPGQGMNLDIMSIVNSSPELMTPISILSATKAIKEAASDPSIKFIYIDANNPIINITLAEELRNALVDFRSSGKAVIAYAENYSQIGYYISSVADKIYSDPLAMNDIIGLSGNMFFFKDLLTKLGVEVQLIKHGKFKSAGEVFTENSISPENKMQNQEMINSLWNTIANEVTNSRQISRVELDNAVNNLELLDAQGMLDSKLVDQIYTKTELIEQINILAEVSDDEDLEIINLDDYSKIRVKPNLKANDRIAIIYAEGDIMPGDGIGITSDKYVRIISEVRKDEKIKAVVLRVNSPGGSAPAAEIIRQELIELQSEKPLIVSFGSYAASGGYWISAGANKIFTNNTTLTGSIGVFSLIPNFENVLDGKLSIGQASINSHKYSDMYSLTRRLKDKEVEVMTNQVNSIYDMFLGIVSDGRKMTKDQVEELAQGRVWTGAQAVENGLANEIGGINQALEYAASISNLNNYRIVEFPKPQTPIEVLMDNLGMASSVSFSPEQIAKEFQTKIKSQKGIFARMPVNIVVN